MTDPCQRGIFERAWLHAACLLAWIGVLGLFFAQFEIQVEGAGGWAANLPTWRIERHPLIDIFWGGRPLTGYHVWIFSFMALAFHLPFFVYGRPTLKLEARILGCLMIFWIVEDCLWFALNPAYGLDKLVPQYAAWHKHWLWGVPLDYVTFLLIGAVLIWLSFRRGKKSEEKN